MKYYYLAEKKPDREQDINGKKVSIPQESTGSVYTDEETICRFSHKDYDLLVSRVKRISDLLNNHGE